jgi:FixJ family two-component response regulator
MKQAEQMVMVIDDDPSVRTAIAQLLGAVGLTSETFASGEEFLEADLPDLPRCLVLDVRLPGLSGLNLQRELSERKIDIPIIFITGHGDIPMTVQAMKAGAVEFLSSLFETRTCLTPSSTQPSAIDLHAASEESWNGWTSGIGH